MKYILIRIYSWTHEIETTPSVRIDTVPLVTSSERRPGLTFQRVNVSKQAQLIESKWAESCNTFLEAKVLERRLKKLKKFMRTRVRRLHWCYFMSCLRGYWLRRPSLKSCSVSFCVCFSLLYLATFEDAMTGLMLVYKVWLAAATRKCCS